MQYFDFYIDDMFGVQPQNVTYKQVIAEAKNFAKNNNYLKIYEETEKTFYLNMLVAGIYEREAERHKRVGNIDYGKKLRRRSRYAIKKAFEQNQGE